MKTLTFFLTLLISAAMVNSSASSNPNGPASTVKEELVTYSVNGVSYKGVIAYDSSLKGKRPAIVVVPEWWGLNEYVKMRAHMLAELGYVAMAADMFGEGRLAADPKEAQELATPYYKDPQLAKSLLDAAVVRVKQFSDTDPSRVAAIGYCFGGFVVLNAAKLGSDLKGVVSFHGGLTGVPVKKDLLKASVLVCHGGSDKFVSMNDYNTLKHQLDSIGADNTFRVYAGATHAFTNPESTQNGKKFNMPIEYNEKADKDSWNDMKEFLTRIFKK